MKLSAVKPNTQDGVTGSEVRPELFSVGQMVPSVYGRGQCLILDKATSTTTLSMTADAKSINNFNNISSM